MFDTERVISVCSHFCVLFCCLVELTDTSTRSIIVIALTCSMEHKGFIVTAWSSRDNDSSSIFDRIVITTPNVKDLSRVILFIVFHTRHRPEEYKRNVEGRLIHQRDLT